MSEYAVTETLPIVIAKKATYWKSSNTDKTKEKTTQYKYMQFAYVHSRYIMYAVQLLEIW